ncbi:MAG: nicotinate (nicotinamide) nucleotide adenylyltransferase [Terracidiphilus sp.]
MDEPQSGGRRVAFFGGSFDPPHLGHLAVARTARRALGLDTVLFAPVGAQPLKPDGPAAAFPDRMAMTCLAIGDEPGLAVSLADAPKPSGAANFTLETLQGLRAELPPGSTLFCLMGADSFFSLHNWHRAAEIPFAAPLIVASRPGQRLEDLSNALPEGLALDSTLCAEQTRSDLVIRSCLIRNSAGEIAPFYILPGLNVDISATQVRDWIRGQISPASGASVASQQLLPRVVLEYIRSHHLYM